MSLDLCLIYFNTPSQNPVTALYILYINICILTIYICKIFNLSLLGSFRFVFIHKYKMYTIICLKHNILQNMNLPPTMSDQ